MGEKDWVRSLIPDLSEALKSQKLPGVEVWVSDAKKLPYTCEIHKYAKDDTNEPILSSYETDLLVFDTEIDGRWTPRVVVECKLGGITTHDALTYSAKAATHKHVHPYLRYGILAGDREHYAIPGRLVKHGAYFDFMAAWPAAKPTKDQWSAFCTLISEEVQASRSLQALLTTSRSAKRKKYHILHRPLVLK